MTARPLIIVGGGGHAEVVADAARSRPETWHVLGSSVPAGVAAVDAADLPILGDDEAVARRVAATDPSERPALVLGFGGPAVTRRGAVAAYGPDAEWAVIVHATAWVSPSARLGPGTVVLAGATVNAGAVVGRHVIVNTRAVVEHDVRLGDGVHLAPGAVIGGGTSIGEDTVIGLGAAVRDHIEIGARSVVGMGAVVVAALADDVTVMGVPARPRGGVDG